MSTPRVATSTSALPPGASGDPVLTDVQISDWRERGFTLVDGVLPAPLLKRVVSDVQRVFPCPGSPEAERIDDFGSGGRMTFPAENPDVNEITLHPRLLRAVSQLLDRAVRSIRLTQSDLWPKYGRTTRAGERDNQDQRIHVDYPNHTLVHPPRWHEPEAVEILLYLSDLDACGGPTAVVPREGPDDPAYAWPIVGTPGVGEHVWINDRVAAEAHLREHAPDVARWRAQHLYAREATVRFRTGTLLFYRHDTWHRGTPLVPGSVRFAQNLTFRAAESEWVSTLHSGWAWSMYRRSRVMERLIAAASVDQRCVLGFPPPGHDYWSPETLDAVEARYSSLGFDVTPYRQARPA